MTALPAAGYVSDVANRTNGEMQSALEAIVSYTRERNGAGGAWVDVATASTVTLGSQTGRMIRLTGTTSITSFGTTNPGDNILYLCRAAASFTLTNGANLITITGADIQTAAGDLFWMLWEGSNVWRMVGYNRADGTPVSAGAPIGMVAPFANGTVPSGWLECNGQAVSRTTYANLFARLVTVPGFTGQTFTVTIASPGVFTKTAHGLTGGERLRLSTTGALPTGLNTSTDYFIIYVSANTFQVSTTLGGAAVNTSGTQSGTHTYTQSLHGLGDGSTTFNVPDLRGEVIRGWDNGRGVDTGGGGGTRAIGTWQADAFRAHTHNSVSSGATVLNSAVGNLAAGAAIGGDTGLSVTGSTGGTETRPRNLALMYCIKV